MLEDTNVPTLEEDLQSSCFYYQTICPICSNESQNIDSVFTINPNSRQTFDLLKCSSCQHWWISPLPYQDYLNSLYNASSEYVITKDWKNDVITKDGGLTIPERHILNCELEVSGLQYLEIGVGAGHLFQAFQDKGCICSGVEPGSWGKRMKNVYYNISELPSSIKYDIIVANDVLEHVEKPVALLQTLRKYSNSGTRIYCSFPNNSSFRACLQKGKWRMVRPIGHLHFFSGLSAKAIFEMANWQITKCNKTDLFEFSRIKSSNIRNMISLKTLGALFVEMCNLGDQWLICARPDS